MPRVAMVWAVLCAGATGQDLEIDVSDAIGTPQSGVPLRLVITPGPSRGTAPLEIWRGVTGPDGRARAPAPRDRADTFFWTELAALVDLRAEVLIPAPWPLEVHVCPPRLSPGRPLQVVIPATAGLRVHVIDRRGRSIEDATVRILGRPNADSAWREMDEATTTADGEVMFANVPVGLEVLLFAAGKRGRWQPAETVTRTPTRAGAERKVRLHFRSPNTRFHLRVVDVDGVPLVRERIWIDRRVDDVSIDRSDIAMPGVPFITDEDGDLEIRLDRAVSRVGEIELVLSRPDPNDESRRVGPWTQAVVDVTSRAEPGRVVLGEVRLAPLPVLASGRVVTSSGAPVRRAIVRAFEDVRACAPIRDAFGTISLRHPAEDGSYMRRHARTKTTRDGRFELRGSRSERDLWIVVRRHGYQETVAARLVPGDDGLRFVLVEASE